MRGSQPPTSTQSVLFAVALSHLSQIAKDLRDSAGGGDTEIVINESHRPCLVTRCVRLLGGNSTAKLDGSVLEATASRPLQFYSLQSHVFVLGAVLLVWDLSVASDRKLNSA